MAKVFKNDELRKRAEKVISKEIIDLSNITNEEVIKIFHELEVHQIELELQNNELKKAQKALEDERNKFSDLYNHAPVGYLTIDDQKKIIQVNQTLADMVNRPFHEIIGQPVTDFILWDDRDLFHLLYQRMIHQNNPSYSCQLRMIKDNHSFHAKLEAKWQQQKRMNIVVTDVSELIAAKEKAQESDRLKSAFLANMSHEIRTPMNSILGFADLLRNNHLNDTEQQQYIDIILESGERMLSIINDLIDISKIEANQMRVNYTAVNFCEQIRYISDFFKPELEKKHLKLKLHSNIDKEDPRIHTDQDKFFSILTNLIKNAIKYSMRGVIEITCRRSDKELLLAVKDSGIGISKEDQQYIFDRFVKARNVTNKAIQGSGLGLAITKGYVDLLGGDIWFESEENVGSTFYVKLPI